MCPFELPLWSLRFKTIDLKRIISIPLCSVFFFRELTYLTNLGMSNIYNLEPVTKGKVLLTTTHGDIEIELWAREVCKFSH